MLVVSTEIWILVYATPAGFQLPAGAKYCSLIHCVQIGSGAYPTSHSMGTMRSSLGIKRLGCEADRSPPSSAEVKNGEDILSSVLVTEKGFGLVIGFINHSQVVTTINYNTVTNFHFTSTPRQSSQSISTCLHYPFPGNGSQHRNYHTLNLQMLHINQSF
jgi:hypothetical protein